MDEEEQLRRQTSRFSREARDRRIFAPAREGFPYDEIKPGSRAEAPTPAEALEANCGALVAPESRSTY